MHKHHQITPSVPRFDAYFMALGMDETAALPGLVERDNRALST